MCLCYQLKEYTGAPFNQVKYVIPNDRRANQRSIKRHSKFYLTTSVGDRDRYLCLDQTKLDARQRIVKDCREVELPMIGAGWGTDQPRVLQDLAAAGFSPDY